MHPYLKRFISNHIKLKRCLFGFYCLRNIPPFIRTSNCPSDQRPSTGWRPVSVEEQLNDQSLLLGKASLGGFPWQASPKFMHKFFFKCFDKWHNRHGRWNISETCWFFFSRIKLETSQQKSFGSKLEVDWRNLLSLLSAAARGFFYWCGGGYQARFTALWRAAQRHTVFFFFPWALYKASQSEWKTSFLQKKPWVQILVLGKMPYAGVLWWRHWRGVSILLLRPVTVNSDVTSFLALNFDFQAKIINWPSVRRETRKRRRVAVHKFHKFS